MLRPRKRPDPKTAAAEGSDPPELPEAGPDDPAAAAFQAAFAVGYHHLRANDQPAREGDVEGVHHLRVTTRRLRSTLDLFQPLTDSDWSAKIAEELKWLGGLLGEVRDLDVLIARLMDAARAIEAVQTLDPLFARLRDRHAAASEALREALRSERYDQLATTLAASLGAIPLSDAASEPCRKALPKLVDDTWKKLKQAGRALTDTSPDAEFHDVRKRAKRARYAAEAVRDALDPDASDDAGRFARRARDVQDVLGRHQDAVVAAAEIHQAADAHPDLGAFNFAAGRLLEREQREAQESRDEFFEVWDDLDRKRTVRWLKP
jgi:CHAD domain-containing protein